MSNIVSCRCGQRFAAAPHLAGKRVACPKCGAALDIPPLANALPPTPSPLDFPDLPAQYAPLPTARPTRQPPPKRTNYVPFIIGGVVMFMLCGCGGVGWLVVSGFRAAIERATGGAPLAVRDDDYAAARAGFRTRLIRRGPSPQEGEALVAPPGAVALSYRSGNLTLTAFVNAPPPEGVGKRPGVIFLHGGFAYGAEDWDMARPYHDAGYVVMIPVLRGENGQPGDFTMYYDEVQDVLGAAEALAQLPYVDANNIFVCGHSAGGSLAAMAALTSDRFRAAASFSGAMNQQIMLDGSWDEAIVFSASDETEIAMRSPEAFARSFRCPTRLYYGTQEIWPPGQTRRTVATARAAGRDVEAVVVPGDHFTHVGPAIADCLTFFEQHLQK